VTTEIQPQEMGAAIPVLSKLDTPVLGLGQARVLQYEVILSKRVLKLVTMEILPVEMAETATEL
jgi:hypothetical protein